METPSRNADRSIPSLDGLRAVSIGMVILTHLKGSLPASWQQIPGLSLFADGERGVAFFFVISGFLITHLLLKELDKTGRIDLKRFYVRRSFRIFPAYYLYLGVIGLLWAVGIFQQHWGSYVSALTYTWNYYPSREGWFLGHCWSLCLEEQFYLIWPALLLLCGRRRSVSACLVILAVEPLIRAVTFKFLPDFRSAIGAMLPTRLDTLLCGALIALFYGELRTNPKFRPWFHPVTAVAAAAVLFFISPWSNDHVPYYAVLCRISVDSAAIALIVLYAVMSPSSWLGWILNTRPLKHVGLISYSLYLWQQLFTGPSPWNVLPYSLPLIFLFGEVSFRFVERPMLRLRDSWDASRRANPAASLMVKETVA